MLEDLLEGKEFLVANASGTLSTQVQSLERWVKAGVDVLVTKTATYLPRKGYPDPVVAIDGERIIQAMGLPNPGYKEMARRIERIKSKWEIPLIASFTSGNPREARAMARELGVIADALEFNASCPHVGGVGSSIGFNFKRLKQICKAIARAVEIPFGIKCPYYPTDDLLENFARVTENASFYTCINSVGKAAIFGSDPGISHIIGGLSGKCIKPLAVGQVFRLRKLTDKYIFGCGGIVDRWDVAEFIKAGANGIQLGSGLLKHKNLASFVSEARLGSNVKLENYFLNMKKSDWD